MKDEKIEIKRDVWNYFRSYRIAPIQKRYLEKGRIREIIEIKRQYHQHKVNH